LLENRQHDILLAAYSFFYSFFHGELDTVESWVGNLMFIRVWGRVGLIHSPLMVWNDNSHWSYLVIVNFSLSQSYTISSELKCLCSFIEQLTKGKFNFEVKIYHIVTLRDYYYNCSCNKHWWGKIILTLLFHIKYVPLWQQYRAELDERKVLKRCISIGTITKKISIIIARIVFLVLEEELFVEYPWPNPVWYRYFVILGYYFVQVFGVAVANL